MSAPDWDMVAETKERPNFGPPPTRDMDMTEGHKLTLGDTTLTFYITQAHAWDLSLLVPVTDNGRPHLVAFRGGSALPRTLEPSGKVGRMDGGSDIQAIASAIHQNRRRRRRRRLYRQPPVPRLDFY